jgi:hypothetical protein
MIPLLIEGTVQSETAATEIPAQAGDAFAAKTGFDPREPGAGRRGQGQRSGYAYFRIRPQRLQAWREANELAGRDLIRDGDWVTP